MTRTLPPQPVHTFKGVLAGREDIRGRFNLTDGGVEGVVYAPEGWYYVEPLQRYLPEVPAGELVVYRHSDIKPGQTWRCGVSLPHRLQRGVDQVAAQVEAATPTKFEFDIATEADYEYVQALGGSTQATREILGIMNQVEGVYQSELLLQIQIGFQHTWTTKDDSYPYTATVFSALLSQFAAYWNANFAESHDYDLAHIWTDLESVDRSAVGIAFLSVVCNARNVSYGLSSRPDSNIILAAPHKYLLAAHEIGHNFGAVHPNEVDPPIEICDNTIMAVGWDGSHRGMTFCQFSRQQIEHHLSLNNSCLVPQPIELQPPGGLSAKATSKSGINLTWQDNSTNETGFIVQRRRDGSGVWVQIGTTAANVERFSDGGLFSEATYLYRVRAFNDTESSAYSNEAAATTLAGSVAESDWIIDTIVGGRKDEGDKGAAIEALLSEPRSVAVDGSGNVYIADAGNHRVRRVNAKGIITTIAGIGESRYGGDGGPAVEAPLYFPSAVEVDGAGNLYIADSGSFRIRRVDAAGIITTIAGTGQGFHEGGLGGYGGDGGPAVEARMHNPNDLAFDGVGNLYIADNWNHRIRRVDTAGIITTFAGIGEGDSRGDDGLAVAAGVSAPEDLAVDGAGNLYIADRGNHRVRRVDAAGIITTFAGTGEEGFSGDGGPAVGALLKRPSGVAVDGVGNLYIADSGNHRIRRVDAAGIITTIAGSEGYGSIGDNGPAVEASLYYPYRVAVDGSGNLYIVDGFNRRIRRVDPAGTITTIVGIGIGRFSEGEGPASEAVLIDPTDVALDGAGNLYISDWNRIHRVDTRGTITTIAGTGISGFAGDGGPALEARLNRPAGIAADSSGNVYVADTDNHRIRILSWPPNAPTRLTATAVSSSRIELAWQDKSTNEKGFRIERWVSRTADWIEIGTTAANTPWFADMGLEPTTTYEYRVQAFNIVQSSAVSNVARAKTLEAVPPTLTRFNPTRGPVGARVTLTGTHLYEATAVAFNGVRAPEFEVVSGTSIEVIVPHGATSGPISVVAPGGTAVSTEPFTVVPPPTLTRFTPTTGPAGTGVTLTGTHFLGATDVRFNGVRAAEFEVVSGTTIEAVVPPGATSGPISVVTPGGMAVSAERFTVVPPPTLTGFTPATGPVGTGVTLNGTHFLGATDVRFNGVRAVEFEVVSGTSIEAVVPSGATSGPIIVVTPGGMAVSAEPFTVTTGIRSRLFVPVVLRSQGRTPGSFFTSEMTLTNRGSTTAEIHYTYRASFGVGSGTAVDSLGPGRQRIVPDAIAYLTSLGVPIGKGAAGGTLVVDFSNLSSESDAAVTVRTSTPVEDGGGQAGLAYLGVTPEDLLTGTSVIAGLRQNRMDRSNLAVQNAGDPSDGAITLRVTVYSGDPETPGSLVLPELSLPPGGFHQYNGILTEAGFENGYVKVERVSGTAAYYAYGVINDNFNSDGSFVFRSTNPPWWARRGRPCR